MTVASSQFLRACRLQPVDYTPVWFMRQSGRYLPQYRKLRKKFDVLTISKTPELATKAALIPVKVLGVDAAIIFADLMSPVEAMGIDFKIVDGTGPVIENPIRNMADIASLKQVDPQKDLDFVLTAIKQIKKELKDKVPLIGFSGAPFTLACYLVEGVASRNFEKTKALMFSDIQAWSQLLSKLTKVVISYLLAQIEAGCAAVQVFDSWAGVLSASDYQKYVAPYSKQVFDKVSGAVPAIHFTTGNPEILPNVAKAGGDVIGVDWRISIGEAAKIIGETCAIQGNLDPAVLLADFRIVKEETRKILDEMSHRKGHIFNLGHGIYPNTPFKNVIKLVEFVHQHTRR